jgi:hypothetical protein
MLCIGILCFILIVVYAAMAVDADDDAVAMVYATNRCPADQIVHIDGGSDACLVRVRP